MQCSASQLRSETVPYIRIGEKGEEKGKGKGKVNGEGTVRVKGLYTYSNGWWMV